MHITSTYTQNIINKIDDTMKKYITRYKENQKTDDPKHPNDLFTKQDISHDAKEILKALQYNFKKYISQDPKKISQTFDRIMEHEGAWKQLGQMLEEGLVSWEYFARSLQTVSAQILDFDEKYAFEKEQEMIYEKELEELKKLSGKELIQRYSIEKRRIEENAELSQEQKEIKLEEELVKHEKLLEEFYKEKLKEKVIQIKK